MKWTPLHFGKYSGKTLPQIIFSDPDYFFWAIEQNVFARKGIISKEAEVIYRRACSVKIPDNETGKLEIEHLLHPPHNTYARFDIEPKSKPLHKGGSPAFRTKYADFSYPRRIKGYDKSGYKLFIQSFKTHILQDSKIKLTKKICENFFSNSGNFGEP